MGATGQFVETWHGAGNDFLVAVRAAGPARLDRETVVRWCDRHRGVGADGVCEGTFGDAGLELHLRNADGSPAEVSGNGLRCLAAAVVRRGLLPEGTFDVVTDAGPRRATVALEPGGARAWGEAEMGEVTLEPGGSLERGVRVRCGNPHVVVADDGADEAVLVARAAALTEGLDGGANVEFVTPIDEDRVAIRVVERGVGLTLACGTGSCATAAVVHRLGLTTDRVVVENQGGELVVTLRGTQAMLAGPAVRIGEVLFEEPW